MIISREVPVRISPKNLKYLEERGYEIPREKDNRGRLRVPRGTQILVKLNDLPLASNAEIVYQCEDCGIRRSTKYYTLLHNTNYQTSGITLCPTCGTKRNSGVHSPCYKHGEPRYSEYRNNAKNRGISFELSVEEFVGLINQPCHYCGGYSSDYKSNSRGNGIDRKDSSKGYTLDNCVPCCSMCNYMKNSIPYDQFVNHIKRIAKHMKG